MYVKDYTIGTPTRPEDHIFIPPANSQVTQNISRRDAQAFGLGNVGFQVLPEGGLDAWFGRKQSETSQDEQARRVGMAILAAASATSMFPPPPVPPAAPPVDPGPAPDDAGEAIIPIREQEFGIVRPVFDQVAADLEYRRCEEAGVLFGVPGTNLATLFVRDRLGKKTAHSFTLDTCTLNEVIRGAKQWNLELLAVVHSHPPGVWAPSAGDIHYARQLFAHPRNGEADSFFLPLLVNGILIPYLLHRSDPERVVRAQLKIIG